MAEPIRRAHEATAENGLAAGPDPREGDAAGGPVHARKERQARGYKWETATPGNYLALRSGYRSPRLVTGLAADLADALLVERPDLVAYRFAVSSWARSETISCLVAKHLDEVGVVDENGNVRDSLLATLRAAERRAAEERARLGLDPTSSARLARERATAAHASHDLTEAIDVGRRVLELRPAPEPGDAA